MTIRIVDKAGVPTKGCTSFPYKNFTISLTNIMTEWVEVMVFCPDDPSVAKSFDMVEQAVRWIDSGEYFAEAAAKEREQ